MLFSRTRTAGFSFLALTFFLCSPGAPASLGASQATHLPEVSFANQGPVEQADPFITLGWEPSDEPQEVLPTAFELQQDVSADFPDPITRYRGNDRGSFISGLPEGDFFFRVRAVRGEGETGRWSEPLRVTVRYHSLAWAFFLFGIGAVVSLATIGLVVVGDRRSRRTQTET